MTLKTKLLCVILTCFVGINTIDAQGTTTETVTNRRNNSQQA